MTEVDPQALRAAADRVLELHEAGDLAAARELCLAVERDAGDRLDHPVVRESVFTARFQRGVLAAEDGDLAGAAAGYLAAAALPADPHDPDQTHEVAMALVNAGICWTALGDDAAALATYDDLLVRVGDARDVATREQVVRARVNRAVALLELDRTEEAAAAAAALATELTGLDDPAEAEQRAMALRIRATALRELDRVEAAVVALAEAETLADAGPGARVQAVAAHGERAELLRTLGRAEEAIDVLDAATRRFADDLEVRDVVAELVAAEVELLEAAGDGARAAEVRARVPA